MNSVPLSHRSRSLFTKVAFTWMHLAGEPFTALYTLLLFILRKDLNGTTLQISIFATIRPVISVFSFYWSANLLRDRSKLLSNLMGAWVLARLPFLCVPFIDNVWFLILAAAIYQLFSRAGMPAMMEILKLNMDKDPREKLFARIYVLSFIESILLGLFIGRLLDMHESAWKILFFSAALLSISSVFIQMRIPLPADLKQDQNILIPTTNRLLQPIKDCIHLMRTRPDFAHFQWGFMIGGFGLMLIAPALQIYFADTLALTHNDLSIARYIWMGVGVVGSSFLWRRALNHVPTHLLTASIILGFSLFPLTLLLAIQQLYWVNIAFFFYGIAQGGSHLLWHLSGTLFAKEEDSSKFSSVNILTVGIRGLVAPVLGGLLSSLIGPYLVLICGIITCLAGVFFMIYKAPLRSTQKSF